MLSTSVKIVMKKFQRYVLNLIVSNLFEQERSEQEKREKFESEGDSEESKTGSTGMFSSWQQERKSRLDKIK